MTEERKIVLNNTKIYGIALMLSVIPVAMYNTLMLLMNIATVNAMGIGLNSVLYVWCGWMLGLGYCKFVTARTELNNENNEKNNE